MARPERHELPTLWFEDAHHKILSAASGVAYTETCGATTLSNWTDVGPKGLGMPDASAGPPRLSGAVMTRIVRAVPATMLPSFRFRLARHGVPQQGICAGLIAP